MTQLQAGEDIQCEFCEKVKLSPSSPPQTPTPPPPHTSFPGDQTLGWCLRLQCLPGWVQTAPWRNLRQLFYLHTFPFTMTGDCLTNFFRIEKEWQLLCDQSRKTNQIFEERQIFLRSVRDFIRASEIKSRSLRFLAERQRFLRSVRDMYSRKKHASKKLSLLSARTGSGCIVLLIV